MIIFLLFNKASSTKAAQLKLNVFKSEFLKSKGLDESFVTGEMLKDVSASWHVQVAPVAAIIGGLLSQEIIKTLCEKDLPAFNSLIFNGSVLEAMVCEI